MTTTRTGQAGTDEAAILTAVSSRPRPAPPSPIQAVMAFGWRGVLKIKHVPEQLLDSTVTPVLFTLMFTYIFGGAIAGDTGEYLDYILPGVLVMSTLFTTVYSGVAIDVRRTSFEIPEPLTAVGAALGADPLSFILGGGDDHALLATFPDGSVPEGWTVIGAVSEGAGVTVDGEEYDGPTGWTHF